MGKRHFLALNEYLSESKDYNIQLICLEKLKLYVYIFYKYVLLKALSN